jgi:RimJ/RimL family protein N-acetyltransferase
MVFLDWDQVIGPADIEATWEYRRLPEVHDWLPRTGADRDDYVSVMTEPERLAKTLVVELDGRVVGDLMLSVEDCWAQAEVADRAKRVQAEIGYALDPAYAGKGHVTEAVEALLRLCFEDLGLRRVFALCFADNVASWALMERLGMRREAHNVRDSLHPPASGWTATGTPCSPTSGGPDADPAGVPC